MIYIPLWESIWDDKLFVGASSKYSFPDFLMNRSAVDRAKRSVQNPWIASLTRCDARLWLRTSSARSSNWGRIRPTLRDLYAFQKWCTLTCKPILFSVFLGIQVASRRSNKHHLKNEPKGVPSYRGPFRAWRHDDTENFKIRTNGFTDKWNLYVNVKPRLLDHEPHCWSQHWHRPVYRPNP